MRYVGDRFDDYSGATENPKTDICGLNARPLPRTQQ
jgi:hypothetical protein